MIRYNNISRPVHDSNDPLRPSLRPPCPKSECRDPRPPGFTPLDSNGKEAFSRRKELPSGGLRRMKMPQEKNGENTDLKCDLVSETNFLTKVSHKFGIFRLHGVLGSTSAPANNGGVGHIIHCSHAFRPTVGLGRHTLHDSWRR